MLHVGTRRDEKNSGRRTGSAPLLMPTVGRASSNSRNPINSPLRQYLLVSGLWLCLEAALVLVKQVRVSVGEHGGEWSGNTRCLGGQQTFSEADARENAEILSPV